MLLSNELSEKEMRQEIRRLNKNISRRISNVSKVLKGVEEGVVRDILSSSIEAYNKTKSIQSKGLRNLNEQELKSLYRQLTYTESLKTSNAKYVIKELKKYKDIKEKAKKQGAVKSERAEGVATIANTIEAWDRWGSRNKNKYNKVMSRLKEQYGGLWPIYKYDIEQIVTEKVNSRKFDVERITQDVISKIDEYYKEDTTKDVEEWF